MKRYGIWCMWAGNRPRPPGTMYEDGWMHGRDEPDSRPTSNITFHCREDAEERVKEHAGNDLWRYEVRPLVQDEVVADAAPPLRPREG